jgi:hypothetical protein
MTDEYIADPDPCSVFGCAMKDETLTVCVDHRCPHRWQREAAEDRGRCEEKDRLSNSEDPHTPHPPFPPLTFPMGITPAPFAAVYPSG